MRALAFALIVLAHAPAWAETLRGKVVGIADGDTLTVLSAENKQYKVRLGGIDAPERRQPHYEAARQNLSMLAFGKMVTVDWHKRDVYGRLVGKVEAEGRDVGLAQVRAGLAWWFRKYAHEQSTFERSVYESAEREAQKHNRGLWRSSKPMPPWEWRAAQRAL
jgi:endonuclease YncB( thermonuclease family)